MLRSHRGGTTARHRRVVSDVSEKRVLDGLSLQVDRLTDGRFRSPEPKPTRSA